MGEVTEKIIDWKIQMLSYQLLIPFFTYGIQALKHRWNKCRDFKGLNVIK